MGDNSTQGSRAVEGLGTSLATGAQNAFNAGNQVFDRPLYAGTGARTRTAVNGSFDAANGQLGYMQPSMDYANWLTNKGGLTDQQRNDLGSFRDVAGGFGSIAGQGGLTGNQRSAITQMQGATDRYGSMYGEFGDPSLSENTLMGTARGDYLAGGNPYFEANLKKATDTAYADVMASLGGTGRTGSNIHIEELGNTIGGLQNSARGQQYETERDRQVQALGMIEGTRQQDVANRFNALSGQLAGAGQVFGSEQAGIQNTMNALQGQMGATQASFNGRQQGISNQLGLAAAMPAMYQGSQLPYQTMLEAGAYGDTTRQAALMADYDLFNRRDPYSHLAKYGSLLAGMNGAPGTQEQTPWWQQAIGGAASLAGAFL